MRTRIYKVWAVVLSFALVLTILTGDFVRRGQFAQAAEENTKTDSCIRVDINKDENRPLAWSEQFYNWNIGKAQQFSTTINGITFTLSNGGAAGGAIRGALSKGILREGDPTSPRLTADGVLVDFGDSEGKGGTIKLEISGLSAGVHTLKTWHSYFDAVTGSSMTLAIDGKVTETIKSVTRAYTDDDAYITYQEFEAAQGRTVTVLISPNGDGAYDNAVLNAFAIDDVDPVNSIKNPYPPDGEMHFQQEEGLSWTAAEGALSHDVYLGTDYAAVKQATTSSAEFQGNQKNTVFKLGEISHLKTYYWRIDEHTQDGVVKGEVMSFEKAHLAFPTAEGYGRFAKGGRGGRVIEVTNLNDSGPGSLRQAVEVEKGPRVVVFRVGGVIQLESRLKVPADGGNVYIAGQTAPGDGITLTHHAFGIYYAKDVIIRHIRLRVGDANGVSTDGMGMAGADHSIIDHCSIAWTTDEGTSSRSADHITFQHNLIAEALNNSVHYDADDRDKTERHSFAGSISGDIGSFHHNLLVNCTGRNWSLAGGMEQDGVTYAGRLDVRNNVVYNFRNRTTDGGVKRINFVNNYYKMGAVSRDMKLFTIDGNELNTNDMQKAYVSGNMLVDRSGKVLLDASDNAWEKGRASSAGKNASTADVRSDEPFFPSYVNTDTAQEAYESVLADVGATVPQRDYLDQRYVKETREGSYTYTGSKDQLAGIIDSQEDVGGYPKLKGGRVLKDNDHDGMPNNWEELHGLNPNDPEDRNGTNLSLDGYTNLEMYLNELAGDEVRYAEYIPGIPTDEDPYEDEQTGPNTSSNPSVRPSEGTQASEKPSTSPQPGGKPSEETQASGKPSISPQPSGNPSEGTQASGKPSISSQPSGNPSEGTQASEKPSISSQPGGNPSEGMQASEKPSISSQPSGNPSEGIQSSEQPNTSSDPSVVPSVGPERELGDIDQNGAIDLSDAQLALKAALKIIQLNAAETKAADVDKNNRVDLSDAQQILKRALKMIDNWGGSIPQMSKLLYELFAIGSAL